MKNLKLQSAMEYLMTYGWAILIIAVVLGALFQLGVFNSSSFAPKAPPGACQVLRPGGPGTTQNINLMGVCNGQLPQYVGKFNGASSLIDAGNPASLNLLNSITVSAWIKVSTFTAFGGIVSKYQDSTTGSWYFSLGAAAPYNKARVVVIDSGSSYVGGDSPTTFATDAWTHVAWTWAYTGSGSIMIYTNGVGQQVGFTNNPIMANPHNLDIGFSGYFNGQIANVQIYNTSLSANQIQALYVEGIGGAPMKLQNLVGWWPLNGDAKDYSGNNNNGVPTAVTFTSQYGK